jgi:hypothetical protein
MVSPKSIIQNFQQTVVSVQEEVLRMIVIYSSLENCLRTGMHRTKGNINNGRSVMNQ